MTAIERMHYATIEELPGVIPLFPLENAVVMPGTYLPLNIFEPRYLQMVRDALDTHHVIGMIQPHPSSRGEPVRLYKTGCAGVISSHQETADGRIMLWLSGLCRFDVRDEVPMRRLYREAIPDWRRFTADLEQPLTMKAEERERITGLLKQYLEKKELSTDWKALNELPDMQLIHSMASALPLDAPEKQEILEAVQPAQRVESFASALQFAILERPGTRLQ